MYNDNNRCDSNNKNNNNNNNNNNNTTIKNRTNNKIKAKTVIYIFVPFFVIAPLQPFFELQELMIYLIALNR